MEILQLKEFTTIVRTSSYAETAELLSVSTSTLSRHIKALETELGDELFSRTTRSVHLTEFGKIFLPHAIMILQDYDTGMEAVSNYRKLRDNSFDFGAFYSLDEYNISGYINGFTQQYPNYRPIIHYGSMEELERGFENKLYNIYSASYNPAVKDMQFMKIGETKCMAVVSEKSELARKSKIRLSDLAAMPLFLSGHSNPERKMIEKAFRNEGISPHVFSYGRFEDNLSLLRGNLGAALYLFRSDMEYSVPGLKFIPVEPSIELDYGLGFREKLTSSEKKFVDYMKQFAYNAE